MPDKNTRLDELKKMKADINSDPSLIAVRNRSSFPAWLWWSFGVLLGSISVVVLSANYLSARGLSTRSDMVERKEVTLLNYESRVSKLKEQVAELTTQRDTFKDAVDSLQADIKAGTSVIADYRIMEEESEKLSQKVATLKERRKQALEQQQQLDAQVVALRAENTSLVDSVKNNYTNLSQMQSAIVAADKNLLAATESLTQKKRDISTSQQALHLVELKRVQAATDLKDIASQQTELETELETLEANVARLNGQQTELAGVSAKLVATKTELQSLERDLTTLKGQIVAYESTKVQLSQTKRELLEVEAALTSATPRSETLAKQVANLEKKIRELETEGDKLKAQISADRVTNANLRRVKDDLANATVSLTGRQKEISLAEQELAELKNEVAIKKAGLASTISRRETLERQVANFRTEIQGLETESDKLKAQVSAGRMVSAHLNQATDDLANASAALAGRQKELSLAKQQLAELKKEIAIKNAELKTTAQVVSSYQNSGE